MKLGVKIIQIELSVLETKEIIQKEFPDDLILKLKLKMIF